jgi:uncharacterized protein YggE
MPHWVADLMPRDLLWPYNLAMASADGHTLISVRGEARRTVAPDEASLYSKVTRVADSKRAAAAAAAVSLTELFAELADVGAVALTVQTTRSPITWSTQSIQTHEEYGEIQPGAHGMTGRHVATGTVLVGVRDFAAMDEVSSVLTSRDEFDVLFVSWSVDDDNRDWPLVRADAIHTALVKGQDYASALGGSIVRVEHVADAGLLDGGESSGRVRLDASTAAMARRNDGDSGGMSLDPVPQVLRAIIEARLSATIGPLPER